MREDKYKYPIPITEQYWPIDKDPVVSIQCITYNHENFIREAIEGFLMQKTTFPVEILIHDDASTDNTANIIREYEKKYPLLIKPIYQKENQFSKKKGVITKIQNNRAKGKYIAKCEGDDFWIDPLKLQKQVDFLENNPKYFLCFHKVYELQRDGTLIAERMNRSHHEKSYTLLDLAKGNFIHTPSVCFRNKLEYFSSNKHLYPVGDYPLYMHLAKQGNIYYFPEKMAVYRLNSNSSWNPLSKTTKTVLWINLLLMLIDDFKENALIIKVLASQLFHNFKIIEYEYVLKNISQEEINRITFSILSSNPYITALWLEKKYFSYCKKFSLKIEYIYYRIMLIFRKIIVKLILFK